jgi:hypothetical protein
VSEGALRRTVDDDHAHGQAKASLCAVQVKFHVQRQRPRPHPRLSDPLHLIVEFVYDAVDGRRRLCFPCFPIEKRVLQRILA